MKILLIVLIVIFCAICFSCPTVVVYDYESDEERKFMDEVEEKAPINGFEDLIYEDAYIFVSLFRKSNKEYRIIFAMYQKNSGISEIEIEIEQITITDEFGNIIFEDLNIPLKLKKMDIAEKKYQEYVRFACSLDPTKELLQSEINEEFYNVSIVINGKTIHTILKRLELVFTIFPT